MRNAGYVYLLMNPSMPGLIKIGRTNRDPESRVAELSAATGVPTSFMLIYSLYSDNSNALEQAAHALLESKGFRATANREFFTAPIQEGINALLECNRSLGLSGTEPQSSTRLESTDVNRSDVTENPLGQELFNEAENYYRGDGEVLRDYKRSLTLFKQAAKLGSGKACQRLADMYASGIGCQQDFQQAIEYYTQATLKGIHECYLSMATIFINQHELLNFRKCWQKFLSSERFKALQPPERGRHVVDYLRKVRDRGIPVSLLYEITEAKKETLDFLSSRFTTSSDPDETETLIAKQLTRLLEQDFPSLVIERFELADALLKRRDNKRAAELYSIAAELGSRSAIVQLGEMYKVGIGVPRDCGKALEYFQQAAQLGDGKCCGEAAYLLDQLERYEEADELWKDYFLRAVATRSHFGTFGPRPFDGQPEYFVSRYILTRHKKGRPWEHEKIMGDVGLKKRIMEQFWSLKYQEDRNVLVAATKEVEGRIPDQPELTE